MFFYKNIETIIGLLSIVCDDKSIISIEFSEKELLDKYDIDKIKFDPNHPICLVVEQQLMEYFQGTRSEFNIPIHIKGTSFQLEVWNALREIPYGSVKSYKDIAVEINRPLAVRAVGQANRRNSLPIIIPCHRVIGSNKELLGYAGDKVGMKEKLLQLEGVLL